MAHTKHQKHYKLSRLLWFIISLLLKVVSNQQNNGPQMLPISEQLGCYCWTYFHIREKHSSSFICNRCKFKSTTNEKLNHHIEKVTVISWNMIVTSANWRLIQENFWLIIKRRSMKNGKAVLVISVTLNTTHRKNLTLIRMISTESWQKHKL